MSTQAHSAISQLSTADSSPPTPLKRFRFWQCQTVGASDAPCGKWWLKIRYLHASCNRHEHKWCKTNLFSNAHGKQNAWANTNTGFANLFAHKIRKRDQISQNPHRTLGRDGWIESSFWVFTFVFFFCFLQENSCSKTNIKQSVIQIAWQFKFSWWCFSTQCSSMRMTFSLVEMLFSFSSQIFFEFGC